MRFALFLTDLGGPEQLCAAPCSGPWKNSEFKMASKPASEQPPSTVPGLFLGCEFLGQR